MQRRERRRERMPAHARVLAEGLTGSVAERKPLAKHAVARVAGRGENRERVDATVEEHGDEHARAAAWGCAGACDAFLEQLHAHPAGAVDGEHEPG